MTWPNCKFCGKELEPKTYEYKKTIRKCCGYECYRKYLKFVGGGNGIYKRLNQKLEREKKSEA